jgi:uncharacterized repeat protein (TIGR01451 family)
MSNAITRGIVGSFAVWLTATTLLFAQGFRTSETREPPLADPSTPRLLDAGIRSAGGETRKGDPDENDAVRQADFTVPPLVAPSRPVTPGTLPGSVGGSTGGLIAPETIPVQYTTPATYAGELPTPMVTLVIEGYDVAPTGQEVAYKLTVRNTSRAKARNVVVSVTPPKGSARVKADPPATEDQALTRWKFETLDPGATKIIELAYKPQENVEKVRLEARVSFDFGRYMETTIAQPSLTVNLEGKESAVINDVIPFKITVRNNGRVTIKDIEVSDLLPKGMVYEDKELTRGTNDGRLMSVVNPNAGERSWSIPALAPGETRVLEYRSRAKQLGKMKTLVKVKAGSILKQADYDTDVLNAMLQIRAEGPAADKGVVGQKAGYRIVVENRGGAELKNVCVRCVFPPDMRVARATQEGQPFRDTVQWTFPSLRPGEQKELSVALLTSTPGTRNVNFIAKADKGDEQRTNVRTIFDGIATLSWDTEVPGTAAINAPMTYKVIVSNTGSATARGVRVSVDLPQGIELMKSDPPSVRGAGANANMVVFQPIEIPQNKKATFYIDVRGTKSGEARAIFTLSGPDVGPEPAEHRKSTQITPVDNRNPGGPPPRTPVNVTSIPRP